MTDALDRAIGRLIWVGIRGSSPGEKILEAELAICEQAHVGGIILFDVDVPQRDANRRQGMDEATARLQAPRNILTPDSTRELVEHLRERLGHQLIVSIDQEGGFVSRLNPARGFPAIPSPRAYAQLDLTTRASTAATLAQTLVDAGIDLNLSPCVDVAINPDGPGHTALGRSFGTDPAVVTLMAAEQIRALHAAGVAATIKHFPGHGSARGDTHEGLVDITEVWQETDELAPYIALMVSDDPPDMVMISHLVHRKLDPSMPASVSPAIINGLLRERLGWHGPVMTDSLDMRAIADRFGPGEASVLALLAGADIALEANNLTQPKPCPALEMHANLREAVRSGRLAEERIHETIERLGALRIHKYAATRQSQRTDQESGLG